MSSDLGNLDGFLAEGSIANLDWLDVDEKEYRDLERLPKQNLDIAPDLENIWSHEDGPSGGRLEPNKADKPHTMADLSEAHGKIRTSPGEIAKTARIVLMTSPSSKAFQAEMLRRFTREDLRLNRQVLAQVLEERGLLGAVYVAASDFPGCHNSPKTATTFVRRYASDAKYVLAKSECNSCIHAVKVGQKLNCAVFHKELVPEVPFTPILADEIEKREAFRGKPIQASSKGLVPKERIRLAVLSESPVQSQHVYQGVGENQLSKPIAGMSSAETQEKLIAVSALLKKKADKERFSLKATPIVAFLRREMLKNRTASELVGSLKVAFPLQDLAETRKEWEPVFNGVGIYGTVYSTQDSFSDCHEGADFLAKHNPGVRAIEAGVKCESCVYNKASAGRCGLYGKPLVKQAEELLTWEMVASIAQEHEYAGRLQPWDTKTASNWGSTPTEALKALHATTKIQQMPKYSPGRLDVFRAWNGGESRGQFVASGDAKRKILKTASKYMNEGLYGKDLLRALKASFEVRDLKATVSELRVALEEQGLQGIYYIDPSTYDDYGHGCKQASSLFRSKGVPYIKLADKCVSCVHNVNGNCSQMGKPLVVEPPYLDKKAEQAAILATGPATEMRVETLINNGMSMMAEYQMQNGGLDFELDPVQETASTTIEFGTGKVKL